MKKISLLLATAMALAVCTSAQAQEVRKINFTTKGSPTAPMTPIPQKSPAPGTAWICYIPGYNTTCFVPVSGGYGSGCYCCTVFGCANGFISG